MARLHLFAADILPTLDGPATSAGLRAAQLMAAFQAGGYEVTVSVPERSGTARPGAVPGVMTHSRRTYLDVLGHVRPDIVVWMRPQLRTTPFPTGAVNVCDLEGVADRSGPPPDILARHLAGADLLLAGSAGQRGFWAARLAQHAVEPGGNAPGCVVVPYATPPELRQAQTHASSALKALHVTSPLALSAGLLGRAASWCGLHGVGLRVAAPPTRDGEAALDAIRALQAVEAAPGVTILRAPTLRTIMGGYGPGGVLLDLPDDDPAAGISGQVVDALTHGVPVLTWAGSDLAPHLRQAGAGVLIDDGAGLEAALDSLAALSGKALGAMGEAARGVADAWFNADAAQAVLLRALDRAVHARDSRLAAWAATAPPPEDRPHVLVLTEERSNMRGVRVDVPLAALHEAGRIAGYSVWRNGTLGFSTREAEADPQFDAIWVQRELPPDVTLALGSLGHAYLLDLDDNLLVSPAYRKAFSTVRLQATRSLVRGCTALVTSNARLAGLLQDHAHTLVLDRTVVCPNLATVQPPFVEAGPPGCIVWASSDTPALTGSHLEVVRAIRDFCLLHGLPLVCIGAPPPALAVDAGVRTEHLGLMSYAAYLDRLRGMAPAILVAPLDTAADAVTQAFIDGKSDIKVLEALVTGLVAVASDAPAYRDTDLPPPILCPNDHAGWLAGLELARQVCLQGTPRPELPANRIAAGIGLIGWDQALQRVRLRRPLRLSELEASLALTRSTLERRLLPISEFDAEWYCDANPDVARAIEAGQVTAYEHYARHGFNEKRPGNPYDYAASQADRFWITVLNTLADVRQSLEDREQVIAEAKMRRRRRQDLMPR